MKRAAIWLCGLLIALAAGPAAAQTKFPSKPVRIIVPYAAGGTTDITARIVAEHMRARLGEAVVVENRPGATGIVAIEEMVRSRPDGHTVMVGNISTNGLVPQLAAKKFTIDYAKDVTVVARVSDSRSVFIATTTNFAPRTMTDVIAYAKQRPGQVRFASAGNGSIQQFDFALLMKRAGIELTHIPYKGGGGEIMRDLATGDVHLTVGPYAPARPMIRAGKIKGIAIVSNQRIDEIRDVETMADAGLSGIGSDHWQVMFAPAATPPDVLDALHAAVADAVSAPAAVEAFTRAGIASAPRLDRRQTVEWMAAETARLARTISELKIEMEE